jgi:tetratricopeptide (TPR) repeat protein
VPTGDAVRGIASWLIGVAVCCALALPARARPSTVEKLAADAAAAYRAGDYTKAVELLERAYATQPVAAILYNLAKAYEKQGAADKALDRYQRYVAADDADAKLKARAEQRVAALKAELTPKTPTEPPKENGNLPQPPPPPIVTPPPKPNPIVDVEWEQAARARRRDRGVAIGVGVVGVIAFAAAIGLSVNALSLHDQFARSLVEDSKRSLRDQAQTQALAADCLYGVGSAAVVVAAIFLYRGLRPLPSKRASLQPRLGGVGLAVQF